jgi:hypothetical protein
LACVKASPTAGGEFRPTRIPPVLADELATVLVVAR